MGKNRWRYLYLLDPVQLQTWLEDLALEGWVLEKITLRWGRFYRSTPRRIRYRAEPVRPARGAFAADGGEEKDQLYADLGWKCLGPVLGTFQLYCTGDPSAPETHTDAATLRALWRRERNHTLCLSLMAFGIFLSRMLKVFNGLYWSDGAMRTTNLVRLSWRDVTGMFFMGGLFLLAVWRGWLRCRPYRRLRREETSPYSAYPTSRRSRWGTLLAADVLPVGILLASLLFLAGVGGALAPGMEAFSGDYYASDHNSLPQGRDMVYIDLADLDYRGELRDSVSYVERANTFTALYCSEVTRSTEVYPLPLQYLTTEYYHMRSPYFTRLLLDKLLLRTAEVEEIFLPGVDGVWRGREEDGDPFLLLRRGERVLYLWCSEGLVDLCAQADAAAELLDGAPY